MKVEVKEVEELVRELAIEVEAETVNEKMDAKYTEIRRDATLKGFRKGKAPMNVIVQKFGDEVKADVVDEVIKSAYPQAVKENELRVASPPTITNLNFTDDGGITFTARVEVMPKIENIVYDNLEITTLDIEVTDEEVDGAAAQMRKSFADRRPVDREITATDQVTVDLKKLSDPRGAIKDDVFTDAVIDLSNPVTVREFREAMPGMKKGDTKEIEVVYGDDYPDKQFAGATIKYGVTVKDVHEEILPELDDAFAKATGQAETLLELRLKIRKDIEHQKQDEIKRLNKNEIVGQICEHNKIPLPNGLVNDYLDAMVEDVKKNNQDVDEAEIRSSYHGVASTTLRWNILYNHIGEQEKIQVLKEDTDKVIKRFAENYGITEQQAAEALHKSGKVASVRDTLFEEKVLDFLISKAKVVKREPEGTGGKD